jgi:hypothetical protein
MAKKVCSECGKPLERANQKTCGTTCRSKRSRRIKRSRAAAAKSTNEKRTHAEHLQPLNQAVNRGARDVAHKILEDELRPIVRESITEDVLKGIGDLVKLTPRMVELIGQDMESEIPDVRQKAYSLLARYTLGNSAVAPQAEQSAGAPMQVVFQLPRPGDSGEPPIRVDATELLTCMECQTEKPAQEFVGNSERCQTCHDGLQAKIQERFGPRE